MNKKLKKLLELRAEKLAEMEAIINNAELERRAVSKEEDVFFDTLEKEIRALDKQIGTIESYLDSLTHVDNEDDYPSDPFDRAIAMVSRRSVNGASPLEMLTNEEKDKLNRVPARYRKELIRAFERPATGKRKEKTNGNRTSN